ncbi:MAG: hypothetical protein ACKO2P_07655 [Planctomycetota bacterium]
MKVRRLNQRGMEAFRQRLSDLRQNSASGVPEEWLEDEWLTEVVQPELQVQRFDLETRRDAATYLSMVLQHLPPEQVATDAGLWTWLSLLFFDSVCPVVDGQRTVRNDYHYVFEPRNSRHFYRHLLFIAWQILRLAPRWNLLFLRGRTSSLDHLTVEVLKRLYLTRIPCIFEVLERLYWDPERRRPRPGVTGSRMTAGNLTHRLPQRILQLEKNYDLVDLNADQLIELLGEEFWFGRPR